MGRKRGVQYRDGSFYRVDDRTGFTRRAEDTKEEWDGLIVAKDVWEPRQPQDLVKGIIDDQTVPNPRSVAPSQFVGPLYIEITANLAVGTTAIPLQSLKGLNVGGKVGIMLDSGTLYNTSVVTLTSSGITIPAPGVPFPVSSGNFLTAYEAPGP